MSVAVSCNLPDGLILGVDSAITLSDVSGNVAKVYENAQKIFQLGKRPIRIGIFGVGSLGNRSIGSYVRQFEQENPNKVVSSEESKMEEIVEELRRFFLTIYVETYVPVFEKQTGKKFSDLPADQKPILGLAVGGYSGRAYLSQVWEILIPVHEAPGSANHLRAEGVFGSNWFALNEPIFRYIKGYDRNLLNKLFGYFGKILQRPLSSQELSEISGILGEHEYPIPVAGMPIAEGIAHVRFLVEMVINHHRYSIGAPVVGGKVKIGVVTYKGGEFRILQEGEQWQD